MPSSVHMGGARIPISGRCTRTSSLSRSWRSCCTGIGLTDGGRGREVPGPHGEQDARSRSHQSLRILLLRVLANLKIPWPPLGRLPNEYPICNIKGMDTIQNCFNLPQYYPFLMHLFYLVILRKVRNLSVHGALDPSSCIILS